MHYGFGTLQMVTHSVPSHSRFQAHQPLSGEVWKPQKSRENIDVVIRKLVEDYQAYYTIDDKMLGSCVFCTLLCI